MNFQKPCSMLFGKWCLVFEVINNKTLMNFFDTCLIDCILSCFASYQEMLIFFKNNKICHHIPEDPQQNPLRILWSLPYLEEHCNLKSLVCHVKLRQKNTILFWTWASTFHQIFLNLEINVRMEMISDQYVHFMVSFHWKKNDFTNLNFLFVCISDCLQKFVDIEELAESERFFCNNCKSKQRSTKKFWVRRLPNVSVYTKHKTMEFSFCIYLNSKSICLFFQLFFRRSYVCILNVFDGAHIPERKLIPT